MPIKLCLFCFLLLLFNAGQKLLAAWPPAELLSELKTWLKQLGSRLAHKKESLLKARNAAQIADVLQNLHVRGQLPSIFLSCQPLNGFRSFFSFVVLFYFILSFLSIFTIWKKKNTVKKTFLLDGPQQEYKTLALRRLKAVSLCNISQMHRVSKYFFPPV